MKKFRSVPLGPILLAAAVLSLLPFTRAEAKWSLTPSVSVEEQYNDNVFLTETGQEESFITIVSPGVQFSYLEEHEEVMLAYTFQETFYHDLAEPDFSGHYANLDAWKDFGPRFGLSIQDVFIRSEDPVELTGIEMFERPYIRMGRRYDPYLRNIVEPRGTFRFGKGRYVRVGYRNHISRNDAADISNKDRNAVNGLLVLRLDVHNRLDLFYERVFQRYDQTDPPQQSRDFDGDDIRVKYAYSLNPKTSIRISYRGRIRNFLEQIPGFADYQTHNPRAGVSHKFGETFEVAAMAGYAVRVVQDEKEDGTFSGRIDLSGTYKRLSVDVYGERGYDEDMLGAEILGFYEFWRAGVKGRLDLLERVWLDGYVYFEDDDFNAMDRRDRLYYARCILNVQVLRWIVLSGDYNFIERDSNVADESFQDNRFVVRVKFLKDLAEYFQ